MLKDKMDNSYIDTSWNEMKEILDREMPVKEDKRAFLFWFYGLAGIVLLLIISINIYNETQSPKLSDSTTSFTEENASLNTSESLPHEVGDHNTNLKNRSNLSTKKEPNQHSIQKSKFYISRIKNVNSLKEILPLSDQKLDLNKIIDNENKLNPTNKDSHILESKKLVAISDIHNNRTTLEDRTPETFISPLNIFFKPLTANSLLPYNTQFIQTTPISQIEKKRYEMTLSNRMFDQLNINGELSASMIFPASNFLFSAGIGLGFDQYDLSPGIDQISFRTLISKDVEPNRFAGGQEPPSASNIETRTYNQDRNLYFSPHVIIGSDLSSSFRFGLGYQPRIFIANPLEEQDIAVQEGDSGLSIGQGNAVGFSDLDLNADRIDHYISAKLNYFLSPKFNIGVVYLRQIDKSIKLKPVSGDRNLYDNILDKINRSEVRLGLSYLF